MYRRNDRSCQRCDHWRLMVQHSLEDRVDGFASDFRFIALNIDNPLGIDFSGNFSGTVGSTFVIERGHKGFAAERFNDLENLFRIGGYKNIVGELAGLGCPIGMLNERFASLVQQQFSWQTSRFKSSRNNDCSFQFRRRSKYRIRSIRPASVSDIQYASNGRATTVAETTAESCCLPIATCWRTSVAFSGAPPDPS